MLGLQDRTDRRGQPGRPRPAAAAGGRVEPVRRARGARPDRAVRRPGRRPRRGAERARPAGSSAPCCTPGRSTWRSGPPRRHPDESLACTPFLNYEVLVVVRPGPPARQARCRHRDQLREADLAARPVGGGDVGVIPAILRRLGVPEEHQRIFQSDAAALEETKRNSGVALAVRFAVAQDLANGRLVRLAGPALRADGRVGHAALAERDASPAAAELVRFVTTPRATQAMLRGAGRHRRPVQAVRARHALELSRPASTSATHVGSARNVCPPGSSASQYGSAAAIVPTSRLEARRGRPRVDPDHPVRAPAAAGPSPAASASGGSLSQPSEAITTTRAADGVRRAGRPAAPATLVAIRVPPNRSVTCSVACCDRDRRPSGARSTGGQPGQRGGEREHLGVRGQSRRARIRCRYAVACACIDWLTSQSMTTRRGRSTGRDPDQLDRLPAGTPGRCDRLARTAMRAARVDGRGAAGTGGSASRPGRLAATDPSSASSPAVELVRTARRPGRPGRSAAARERRSGCRRPPPSPPPAAAWPRAARRRPPAAAAWSGAGSEGVACRRCGAGVPAAAAGRAPAAPSSNTAANTASNAARSALPAHQA